MLPLVTYKYSTFNIVVKNICDLLSHLTSRSPCSKLIDMKKQTLGEILRKNRKAKNITSETLAEEVGVNRTYLSKIENNLKIPSQVAYQRIDAILKLGPVAEYYYRRAKDAKSANWLKSKYGIELPSPSLKEIIHDLITTHIKSSKNTSDDVAFCADLITNFIPLQKDNNQLVREFAGVIRKLRRETEDFQKRFLKMEKRIMDLIKPE